jgi:RimJ/RimL family protein N-acetyltransferase
MPFELQPRLRGELLSLRPLKAEDFPALFAVASDPLIWAQHPQPERYQEAVFQGFFRDALASGGALIASDNLSGAVVGTSRFNAYDEVAREVEIGWTFLARSHWGGRYNSEMKQLMLRHAARFVDKVLFVIGSNNRRSRRAVEKLGGVLSGSRQHASGKEDVIYTLVLAEYFAAGSPAA